MVSVDDHAGMKAMSDGLSDLKTTVALLNDRGLARDKWQERIEQAMVAQAASHSADMQVLRADILALGNDVRAAKVALSLGGMLSKVLLVSGGGFVGWVASHLGK